MPFWAKQSGPAFDGVKLRSNLKMGLTRLRMVQNKRQNTVRQQRRHLAELLQQGKIDECRVKVEPLIREDLSIGGLDVLAIFIELVASRQHGIVEAKTCPPELKEAVTSVLWAVPRVDAIQELHAVRLQFALKFGKAFCEMAAANEELSVNDKLIEKLDYHVPTPNACVDYLAGIADEYQVPFDADALKTDECVVGDAVNGVPAAGNATGRFVPPPIVVPRDDLEARLLALKRQ